MRAILTYHSIDSSGSPISLDADTFRAHVRFFASGRVRVLPLADLTRADEESDAVALTFDDAYANFQSIAQPLLHAHGLTATVFVVTDRAGADNRWGGVAEAGIPVLPLMEWTGLGKALAQGMEIGAHTRRHPDLTTLSAAQVEDEVIGSRDRLASELGVTPASFCYPFGRFGSTAERVVAGGFQRACTTELRALADSDAPLRLPRLDMFYFRRPGQIEAWGSGGFKRRIWLRAQGRRMRHLAAGAGGGART